MAPQARHRGGKTTSTTVPKKRRNMDTPSPCIIDPDHRDRIRSRACKDKTHDRFLLHDIASDMTMRLNDFKDKPKSVFFIDDWMHIFMHHTNNLPLATHTPQYPADVAMGLLCLDYALSVPAVFQQARTSLNPGGLIIMTTLGPRTLSGFKEALYHTDMLHHQGAGLRFMPSIAAPDLATLATRAGFHNPVVDAHLYTASYQNLFSLVRDLRAMALGNALKQRCRRPLTRSQLYDLQKTHPVNAEGRFVATFEVLTLVAHL